MKRLRNSTIQAGTTAILSFALLSACSQEDRGTPAVAQPGEKAAATAPSVAEVQAIAEAGFIYGLPIVMNYAVMNEYAVDKNSGQFKAPFNHFKNEARVFTYKDTAIITPNSDTPYSLGFLDLRAEPIVVSVPAVEKSRYYSAQLTDGNTYNYGYIGSRATGNAAGSYMVVAPDWKGEKPEGINKVFRSSTPFSMIAFRTQLLNADDMPNVVKVQSGYRVQPLSEFLGRPTPPAAPKIDFVPATSAGIQDHFWEYLDAALELVPETALSKPIRTKLARIGIGPGKTIHMEALPAEHKAAIQRGSKAGAEKIERFLATGLTDINGWQVGSLPGDSKHYDGNWLQRAGAAKAGIYGASAAEAVYPLTRVDGTGATLDGSRHAYTLTFAEGEYPPVNAFWSLTMYDGKTQLLIENPIDRYLINSRMLPDLRKGADGSLTLHIQKDSPGADKKSNWLPAPDGPIYLVMRLYWPKTEPPSILPAGKGSWKPPGIVAAN